MVLIPGNKTIKKARDALRGATKKDKCTSIWDRWQNDEVHRASRTDMWVKYLDFIAHFDISHDAPHWQRARHNNMVHLRSLDSND